MATTKSYHPLVFRIRALTNLHPGGGDSFYGAVDKLVQRDPATNFPTIHGHSLKGALREYFESELGMDEKDPFVVHVFGSPVKGKPEDAEPGQYRFFGADLLALPVPNEEPETSAAYHLEADDEAWKAFFKKLEMLGSKFASVSDLKVAFRTGLPSDFNTSGKFKEAAEELPVVARNQLDNGESQNLWYEELVPHESIFGFVVQVDADKSNQIAFLAGINCKVIQIGANATVGYGYCLLTLITPPSTPAVQP
jgi:CRISPR-associated protein Cmr4